MEALLVKGPAIIKGEVSIGGSKNSAMAIIPAALLAETPVVLENVPRISDVKIQLEIAEFLGARVQWLEANTVKIDPTGLKPLSPPYELCTKIRASYYLMGVLLARFGRGKVPVPGGCDLGPRPIDQHIKGFTTLGADIVMNHGLVEMQGKSMKGSQIYLDVISVGATINIMLAAVRISGRTVIQNCAKEPEIVDLASFLNAMGARVRGAGTEVIKIDGVKSLHGTNYRVISDRIEAGTFMLAAAATRGQVLIKNVVSQHLNPVIAKLKESGVRVFAGEDTIFVDATHDLRSVDVDTCPYPGFPTDLQSFVAVLLTQSKGTGIITENVFVDRFRYLEELKRLGASIKVFKKSAMISGVSPLSACTVQATDIRAGAACIIAGLVAMGITEIKGVHHIDRGYDRIEDKLRLLGADLVRVNDTSRKCLQWQGTSMLHSFSDRC
ncbi:MAG: UDP-N-acetylglucosamine 1-carboxyvinyltransferase [Clostridia bacterium]